MISLALSFLVIAGLYASVGFGGGSSYIALLSLNGAPYALIPSLGLSCNILVSAQGTWQFARAGHFRWHMIGPFLLGSIPAATVGGFIHLEEPLFWAILSLSLLAVGFRLILMRQDTVRVRHDRLGLVQKVMMGSLMGILAGISGIGGGIFLSPVLHAWKLAPAKEVACSTAVFILCNSLAGIVGQSLKTGLQASVLDYWPLFVAVSIGGVAGSYLGATPGTPRSLIVRGTGVLTLYVGFRILYLQL